MSMTIPATVMAIVASLLAKTPGAGPTLEKRANEAAEAAYKVATEDSDDLNPRFLGKDPEAVASLLVTWSYYESAWNSCAVGDGGNSLGIMQVNRMWLGKDPKKVVCDPTEGFRASLRVLDYLVQKCGSEKAALYGYASGRCFKPGTRVELLVSRRLVESKVTLQQMGFGTSS